MATRRPNSFFHFKILLIEQLLMRLQLKGISLRLGGKPIFQGFNLEVAEGEKVILRGPSGSGKSTLLRLILGFVQPDTGEVRINGALLNHENIWPLRQRIAFVPQELNLGSGQVRDFIRDIFGYRANRHLKYNEAHILTLFEQFGLEPAKLQQDTSKLSGGEKQRVALITALLLGRELYLLDEATSALDEALRDRAIEYLARLEGKSMIITSHGRGWEAYGFREVQLETHQQ